jgi:hypothetical protein
MATTPESRFARNGDVHIAYQTVGSGPFDLLLVDSWAHHVEPVWDSPTTPGSCAGSAGRRLR